MARFQSLLSYITLCLVAVANAAIGPTADLTVSNAAISPDGFTREAVVVNNVFPSPLITGKKVGAQLLRVVYLWIPNYHILPRATISSST